MAQDNFDKILSVLKRIHRDYPDLRFGAVIQEAIDTKRLSSNSNLFDISSKNMLSSLEQFELQTEAKRKRVKKHGNG